MDGVAGRLGRSSTRYGPTSVFSGPVRRWNKKWVALSNPDHRRRSSISGGRHSSRILLYRWTPVAALAKDDATPPPEEPPRRKFRYVPISVTRERKEESLPKSNSSPKLNITEGFPRKTQIDPFDTNPDMNNVSAEIKVSSKDQTFSGLGNGADLDLSLGLRAPDGDHEDESKTTRRGEGYTKSVRAASSTRDTEMKVTKSVAQNKLKRKAISPDLEMAV
ncbi:uncharacterized protein LOC122047195 [Zingiber officinale]|uniref:Uncharacterized protein n=1 Tax=Zingiber officinale TaxID=94328 RepID=A0A8J5I0Y4_ZINOF|nr:uncharacterized protein LOC122047195 [Zingiber officinale]KAG6525903.1 hypothetical protein ZIOFF_015876 [Zingiber officinale]